MTHIPNNYELDLMLSLVKQIDDYNELKEIAFIQYCLVRSIMGYIEAFIPPMPVEFIFELKEILDKCDDFEPEWKKSYEQPSDGVKCKGRNERNLSS